METDGSGIINDFSLAPSVDVKRCSGCGRCVAACPEKIITLQTVLYHKNAVIIHPELCKGCGRCVQACTLGALE